MLTRHSDHPATLRSATEGRGGAGGYRYLVTFDLSITNVGYHSSGWSNAGTGRLVTEVTWRGRDCWVI